MDALFDPIRGDFGLTTLISLVLTGVGCGAVGVWIVQFGRAFLAESLTHALLPGLAAATLLGASLMIGAIAGVLVAYTATLAFSRAPRTSAAASTSVTVTTLVAAGALIAASGGTANSVFESILFGNPVAATKTDLVIGALLLAGIGAALWLAHGHFGTLAFDPAAAESLNASAARVQAVLLLVIVCSVAAAVNVTGSLPALALLVGPAIAADSLCSRIGHSVWVAGLIGAACGAGALYLSYYADWPAGASVAITCASAAAVASCLRLARRSSAFAAVTAQR